MVMIVLGGLLIAVAAVLDYVFRLRMFRIGDRWALLQGGAFDHSRYHRVRAEHGWAAWPVYLMWGAVTCGLALMIAGLFVHFGTSPMHPK
jgi:hypothetical protein